MAGMGLVLLSDSVHLIRRFAAPETCAAVIQECLSKDAGGISLNLPNFETPNVFCDWKPKQLNDTLLSVFQAMKDKWEELTGDTIGWDDPRIRPQVIHYPRGGGFFGRHNHPLEPQKWGLILNLTSGPGTVFHMDGYDIQMQPEAGDLTVFRYDIPHSVPMIDPGVPLEFFSPTERWTAILPIY